MIFRENYGKKVTKPRTKLHRKEPKATRKLARSEFRPWRKAAYRAYGPERIGHTEGPVPGPYVFPGDFGVDIHSAVPDCTLQRTRRPDGVFHYGKAACLLLFAIGFHHFNFRH